MIFIDHENENDIFRENENDIFRENDVDHENENEIFRENNIDHENDIDEILDKNQTILSLSSSWKSLDDAVKYIKNYVRQSGFEASIISSGDFTHCPSVLVKSYILIYKIK